MIRFTKTLRAELLERRELLSVNTTLDSSSNSSDVLLEIDVTAAPIDGVGNNVENPTWGSTETELLRLTSVEYADGISEPAGDDRVSAREISNAVAAQEELTTNDRYLTDIVWLWGQFIDHDIDLSESADPAESFDIEVPTGDEFFDPDGTGEETISLNRSIYDESSGTRQQLNEITAFLDGSMIYGSDTETADSLRSFEGGRLLTSEGDLLPFAEDGSGFFVAGDVRANENVALTAMHTLWVREHNYWADEIAASDPTLSDEEIYQQARAIVIAEIQAITFNEFLPALLGVDAISEYEGYDPTVDPSIANIFSTAAYRFGHSMLSPTLLRLDSDGTQADEGNLALQEAFFAPQEIVDNGIASILLGASSQQAQEIDNMVIDDVRNFLFGDPGDGGFDLASLNIQRGRDHGLADYNQARVDYGLEAVTSFDQITSDPVLAAELEALYGSVDNIDAWVGALAEDHVAGASVGEFLQTVLVDQFERIRDGDRFWYQNLYSGDQLNAIENTTLADVMARNTEIDELPENVFFSEEVLYYATQAGSNSENVDLRVRGGNIEVVDDRSGRVLASQEASITEKVILIGGQGSGTVEIDPAVLNLDLPGGLVIDGQAGRRDEVIVRGTRGDDSFTVNENQLLANDLALQMVGVENLRLVVDANDDTVEVVDEGDLNIDVVTGMRPNRDAGPRGPRNSPRDQQRQTTSTAGDQPGDQNSPGDRPAGDLDQVFDQMGGRRRRR